MPEARAPRARADIERELLAAVLAAPESDGPRLVYADHLQERGDPRGELIAVQCALATMSIDDPANRPLVARERELFDAHWRTWCAVASHGRLQFARGFARAWCVQAAAFARTSASVFGREPIRELDLSHHEAIPAYEAETLAAFARPELAQLHALSLRRHRLRVEHLRELATSPRLVNLLSLDLGGVPMSAGAVEAMTTHDVAFRGLAQLSLHRTGIDPRAMLALARAPYATTLRVLDLSKSTIGDAGVTTLAEATALASLEILDLGGCKLTDQAAAALVRSPVLANIVRLAAGDNAFSPAARGQLVEHFGPRIALR